MIAIKKNYLVFEATYKNKYSHLTERLMGLSPETKKLTERVYQFLAPVLVGLGCYVVYKQGKQIEAVLLLLIGWSAIFYYWIKYFKLPSIDAQKPWPPFLSTCPDYLTLVSPESTGDSKAVCMDFVGISTKPNTMYKANPNSIPQKNSNPDYNYYTFVVETPSSTGSDPTLVKNNNCSNVKARGLTWAHVCD